MVLETANERKFYSMFKDMERKKKELEEKYEKLERSKKRSAVGEKEALSELAENDYKAFEKVYLKINKDRYRVKELRFIEIEKGNVWYDDKDLDYECYYDGEEMYYEPDKEFLTEEEEFMEDMYQFCGTGYFEEKVDPTASHLNKRGERVLNRVLKTQGKKWNAVPVYRTLTEKEYK